MECKFCDWKKHYEKIYENEHVIAVWGSPYVKGHVKIILKRHAENLRELSKEEACAIMEAWRTVGKAIEQVLKPDIINWQINCNWTRHIHGHIYPRFKEDSDWGGPLKLPSKIEDKEKDYVAKELTNDEKSKIIGLLR